MHQDYEVGSTSEPKICNKHRSKMITAKVTINGAQQSLDICPECEKEEINELQEHLKQEAAIQSILANTYKYLIVRASIPRNWKIRHLIITILEISHVNKL